MNAPEPKISERMLASSISEGAVDEYQVIVDVSGRGVD